MRLEHALAIVARTRSGPRRTPPSRRRSRATSFACQTRVSGNAGLVDPERIEDYVACGGRALERALHELTPQQAIDEVARSGLRGRGGAGYPTGVKWGLVARAQAPQKYVICNGDEGDPGPSWTAACWRATPTACWRGWPSPPTPWGRRRGTSTCGEYPVAVRRLQTAIRQAERRGCWAPALDTAFQFRGRADRRGGLRLRRGDGPDRSPSRGGGGPRPRPPYPAQSGLWGQPTLINNVETLANVPPIVARGGAWYAGLGTQKSTGTKVFALAGKIVNTGLIEVPFGATLRQVIYEIGGVHPDGRAFKAVQTGGPPGAASLPPWTCPWTTSTWPASARSSAPGHDRHGRRLVHGRRGLLLHRVLHARVLQQVRPPAAPGRCRPSASSTA